MSMGLAEIGPVIVKTTENRGFTPAELTDDVIAKIIHVSDTAHPAIRDQAIAFRERLRPIIWSAMTQAVNSDRTTIAAKLAEAGQHEAASIVGKL